MVRTRMKDKAGTSVINVKINEANEIELLEVDEVAESDIELEDDAASDEMDEDPELVTNKDGSMTIKMTDTKIKTIVEHVCGRCTKTYPTYAALKRHLNLCRNLPKEETVTDANDFSHIDVTDPDYEVYCFCCNEDKATAHYGHIKCGFCPKSFKSHISLARHLYTLHSASKYFACNSCNATCPNEDILSIHLESHDTGKPFSCQNCGKDFTRKYHLDRHLKYTDCDKTLPKSEIPCHVCGKVFTRTDNLREHLRAHIGQSTRKKDYQCPHCDKSFYGSSLLNIHIRTHTGEKPFPCDLCDKSFPSNGALRKHRRMHTGEKPYACKTCGKCFSAKETLNRHNKIHTGERPHVCRMCDKSFIQATQLRSHMFHHTGENGFACELCEMSFNRRSRLDAHMKSVHPVDSHSCTICSMQFPTEQKMKKHLKVHDSKPTSKKAPFLCEICNNTFSSKQAVQFHMRTHQSGNPSDCTLCNKTFIRADCLERHMKQHHKESRGGRRKRKAVDSESAEEPEKTNQSVFTYGDDGKVYEFQISEAQQVEDADELDEEADTDVSYPLILKSEEVIIDDVPAQIIATAPANDENVDDDELPMFMDDETLKLSVAKLLDLVVDEETLQKFGWPEASIESVLSAVIEQCGQTPADYDSCEDYTTKMRENVKLLFTVVIDNESIKSMLNNYTIDEVIKHVLKLAKV